MPGTQMVTLNIISSGGAYQFESLAKKIYIHKSEENYIRNGSPLMTVTWITPQVETFANYYFAKKVDAKIYRSYFISFSSIGPII